MIVVLKMRIVWLLLTVLLAITIDVVLGIIKAAAKGQFDLAMLPRFLQTQVLLYWGPLVLLGAVAMLQGEGLEFLLFIEGVFYAGIAAALMKYQKEIREKLTAIYGPMEIKLE